MNTNQTDTNQMQEQEIDLIELFYKLLAHWRWFLLAAVAVNVQPSAVAPLP